MQNAAGEEDVVHGFLSAVEAWELQDPEATFKNPEEAFHVLANRLVLLPEVNLRLSSRFAEGALEESPLKQANAFREGGGIVGYKPSASVFTNISNASNPYQFFSVTPTIPKVHIAPFMDRALCCRAFLIFSYVSSCTYRQS